MRENHVHEARALSSNRRFLGLEHEVALILAETSAVDEAYPKVLETVGSSLGWDFGAAWEERLDLGGFVRCAATWCADAARLGSSEQQTPGALRPIPPWRARRQAFPPFRRPGRAVERETTSGRTPPGCPPPEA